jgi:hypothetical protein
MPSANVRIRLSSRCTTTFEEEQVTSPSRKQGFTVTSMAQTLACAAGWYSVLEGAKPCHSRYDSLRFASQVEFRSSRRMPK